MKKVLLIAAVLMLMVSMVSAQSFLATSPQGYDTKYGGANNNWPFYKSYAKWVFMQVHDDLPTRPMLISAMATRNTGSNIAAWTSTMTVSLSTAKTNAGTISTTYASNHGIDKKTVLTNTVVKFPAMATKSLNFGDKIPFSSTFLFANNPTAPKSLCYEWRIHSHTINGYPYRDYVRIGGPQKYNYARSYVGLGGTANGQTRASYNYAYTATVNTPTGPMCSVYGPLYYCGKTVAPITNKPFMWLGLSDKTWGPMTLPFDLSGLGGKGNNIYTEMFIVKTPKLATAATNNAGYYYFTNTDGILIPFDQNLNGLTFFIQHASTDLANTAFPMVFTRACKMVLTYVAAAPMTHSRVWTTNSDTATSGSKDSTPGYGAVTQFEYK